jgi:hypothetical protein
MNHQSADNANATDLNQQPPQALPWLRATHADLQDFDFEAPIAGLTTADCSEMSEKFEAAAAPIYQVTTPNDIPATRVFAMLSAMTGMHFRPDDRHEPFGPMFVLNDRRSPAPEDFRGAPVDVLAKMAERATNPALRARLADVCWLLDRKRGKLGSAAIGAYVETVLKAKAGELKYRFQEDDETLQHESRDYLRRALHIARIIGWEKQESVQAQEAVVDFRKRANAERALPPVQWFGKLDLDSGISKPGEVAADLDDVLKVVSTDAELDGLVDLWRLAARAYHLAKDDDNKYRCQSEAAECLARQAEEALTNQNSAMLAAHVLSAAIAEMHGIPGKKDRRIQLRHRLIDIQAQVPDEMSALSQEMDLREIAEKAENAVRQKGLLGKLFALAALTRSPDPDGLIKDAADLIERHPFASLLGASHLDREGKVIHRTKGGLGNGENESAIQQAIAQSETIRRRMTSFGAIEVARRNIVNHHFLADDVLMALFRYSPLVPAHLLAILCRGFIRFFQGDFVSATYILTPLLEGIFRHSLKINGHDVAIFDDATQTQEDRTISSLFEQMRPELDTVFTKAITTDIENVFLNKPGPYLRHALVHGLLDDGDPYGSDAIYGCWLIYRICLLPLFPVQARLEFPFE